MTNLLAGIPHRLPDELFITPLDAADADIERVVPPGHPSPEGSGTTRTGTGGSCC